MKKPCKNQYCFFYKPDLFRLNCRNNRYYNNGKPYPNRDKVISCDCYSDKKIIIKELLSKIEYYENIINWLSDGNMSQCLVDYDIYMEDEDE